MRGWDEPHVSHCVFPWSPSVASGEFPSIFEKDLVASDGPDLHHVFKDREKGPVNRNTFPLAFLSILRSNQDDPARKIHLIPTKASDLSTSHASVVGSLGERSTPPW